MDNVWEYNCPQYVDFDEIHSSDDADSWFDANYDSNDLTLDNRRTPKKSLVPDLSKSATRRSKKLGLRSDALNQLDISNIENEINALNKNNTAKQKVYKPTANPFEVINTADKTTGNLKRRSRDLRKTAIRHSSRLADQSPEIQLENKRQRPYANVCLSSSSQYSTASITSSTRKPSLKACVPSTPTFMRKKIVKTTVKTSEDLEVEKMKDWQKEILKKHRRLAKARRQSKEVQKGPMKAMNYTIPETFHFETDDRLKSSQKNSVLQTKLKDFVSSLRSNTPRPKSIERTIPKEFNLTRRKRKASGTNEYKSMAERILEFQNRTPARYHTRSRSVDHVIQDKPKQSVVQPRTPNLRSRFRVRPNQAIGYEKQEELQLEEMQKYQFKANPINPKIFESPVVKKNESKKTIPQPFSLSLRYNTRSMNSSLATSVDSSLSCASSRQTTPQFKRKAYTKHSGVSFQPKLEKRSTTPQPFSFDDKDKERKTKKEEKIKEIYEEEKKMREFHANPLPDLNSYSMPAKESKPITKVQPFNLSDKDVNRSEKQKKQMEEELRKLKEKAIFKAKPCEILYKEPFLPKKNSRILTDFTPFELRTDKRAEEWKEIEQQLKQKEEYKKALNEERLARQQEEEEKEMMQRRKETVLKANPVRHYKPLEIKSGLIPLTDPRSPNFRLVKKQISYKE